MPTDWQPYQEMSNGSNPTEAHVGKHLLTGGLRPEDVEPDPQAILAERDLLKQRVAELKQRPGACGLPSHAAGDFEPRLRGAGGSGGHYAAGPVAGCPGA